MSRTIRGLAAFAAAIVVTAATFSPVSAAIGPTVMLFHGGTLKKPVFATGADTSAFGDLLRRSTIPRAALADRPFVDVALFWGPPSDPARNGVRVITDLTPQMAWQHGRFYPARNAEPAVLLVTSVAKREGAVPYPADPTWFQFGGPVPAEAAPVIQRLGITTK